MSVTFPSASGGASYDPSTYLTNPAAAVADPVDTVDITSIGKPPAVTAASASTGTSTTTPASSSASAGNGSTSNYGTGNNSLSSLYGTGNSGTANSATSNLASLLDPTNTSTSNSITNNLAGYLNPTANGNPSSPSTSTTSASNSNASSDAASASNATSWQQEYENFLSDNTEYLLENTFGSSTALDQPSAAFGSTAAINAVTNSTLGVLSQAAALQNPQTLAFQESSTGSTVDTTA
jgi:hypothetical protein